MSHDDAEAEAEDINDFAAEESIDSECSVEQTEEWITSLAQADLPSGCGRRRQQQGRPRRRRGLRVRGLTMSNPELPATHRQWLGRVLQGLLVACLQADSDAGSIRLSAIDGIFGPITEGAVRYFQQQKGLSETGVVDDATWQALEGSGGQGGTGQQNPVDLRVPFKLPMRWDQITLGDLYKGWASFDLAQAPDFELEYKSSIGKLIGIGGVQLLNGELKLWDSWFLDWSTKLVFDFAKDKGVQVGTDNHLDLGLRPTRTDVEARGDMNFKRAPLEAKGDMYLYGGLKLELKFDWMGSNNGAAAR